MADRYTAKDVAKWFLSRVERESGDAITHLKLQKLVYYAQAWHLAHFGKPIFDEDMKAWAHGPVAVSVWHEYKNYGWEALPSPNKPSAIQQNGKLNSFLEAVYSAYGQFTAKALETLTHQESPWRDARGDLPPEAKCDTAISKDAMKKFYRERLKSNDRSTN